MTEKVEKMLNLLKEKEYRKLREQGKLIDVPENVTPAEFAMLFRLNADPKSTILYENDDFGFNRGTNAEMGGGEGNFTPNYFKVISSGLDAIKEEIRKTAKKTADSGKKEYADAMAECINICFEFSDKYKEKARLSGNTRLYNALCKIPHKGAETFYEACVFMKLCIYFIRASFTTHLGLGRFDQYMYPYYLNDKKNGVTDDEILETIELFFISINFDTDLYQGIQQGDNGQSMVLAGFDKDGNYLYNELSEMCMKASLELNLIDPKINLRVGKNTPDAIFEFGTMLTKQGMGFPQYCNDDVVIPGLIKLGYEPHDAYNYVVAACWEHIIPNCGADYPNIATMDFPAVVGKTVQDKLMECDSFESLMEKVKASIKEECDRIVLISRPMVMRVFTSIFIDGCIEKLTDMWLGGAKYYNYGCHGAGIANAADALAAVKKNVFDDKTIKKEELLSALSKNFEGFDELRNLLKNSPKMGNNDDYADNIAGELMETFSSNINNRRNILGGIWRAGTGSAMEYIRKGALCPATADGRKAGEPYSSSFSPSLDVKTKGILSVLQSFTKYDLTNIINGGPLTIEIHDTVFRNEEGIKKTAMLVKDFILLKGHQLQINSINRERLIDAQKHPENYPNLIVRVWGWSGYFNELDLEYQNHIIRRTEHMF